jgi:uncharacterized protein DUF4157
MRATFQSKAKTSSSAPPTFTPVRSGVLQRKCACGGTLGPTGECEACRKKRLQRKSTNTGVEPQNDSKVPRIVHEVLRSPGQPLDAETRAFMEPRFGHDFSDVRVHTNSKATESAQAVNALAYTVGRDVVFGAGQYTIETSVGKRLLAHELTHVVQQNHIRNSSVQAKLGVGPTEKALGRLAEQQWEKSDPLLTIGKVDDSYEREADTIARNIGLMRPELKVGSSAHIQCRTKRNTAGAELPADEAADGMTLTQEEAELLDEAISAIGGETVAMGTEEIGQLQGGIAATKDDSGGKPGKKRVAKRRRRIRRGNFIGNWVIRLLCGYSGKYFRHRDFLSCLKSKRKHPPKREADGRPPPEKEHRVPSKKEHIIPPEKEHIPPPEKEHIPPPEKEHTTESLPPPGKRDESQTPPDPPKEVSTPTFRKRPIPPGSSVVETFEISFNRSSDSYTNETAVAATLASLGKLLKQNPELRITIRGNVFNNDPGIIQGGSKIAVDQGGFYLNGKETTVAEVMLARARRVRQTLTSTLKVANTINVRTGRVMGPGGLKISITITNPSK